MDPSSNPTLTGLACGKPCKGSVADPFKGWYQKARHACIRASCSQRKGMHAPCRRWPRWASASHVAAACSAPARTTLDSTSWPTSRATHPLVYITAGHDAGGGAQPYRPCACTGKWGCCPPCGRMCRVGQVGAGRVIMARGSLCGERMASSRTTVVTDCSLLVYEAATLRTRTSATRL